MSVLRKQQVKKKKSKNHSVKDLNVLEFPQKCELSKITTTNKKKVKEEKCPDEKKKFKFASK